MLNVAVLMGRLVADPELRHTPNDVSVTTITIAVDRSYVKSGAERQADFIDVVAWRGTADFVCKYFSKGQLIAVQGAIQTRSYTDSQGNKRKAFEVVADNVHFAESKRKGDFQGDPLSELEKQAQAAGIPTTDNFSSGSNSGFEEMPTDDDLPFNT